MSARLAALFQNVGLAEQQSLQRRHRVDLAVVADRVDLAFRFVDESDDVVGGDVGVIDDLAGDSSVKALIVSIDSPGGSVSGGETLHDAINRVAATVKGGRRFSFAAQMVVGDQKGRVGYGHGKAREVPEAIRKATEAAKRALTRVALREGRTLHHDVMGRHGAGKVFLRAAPPGTGIIAGGPMRAVFETLGIQDVVAKSLGSSNPYNVVRATFDALKHQDSPRSVAARRSLKVSTLQSRRREGADEAVAE